MCDTRRQASMTNATSLLYKFKCKSFAFNREVVFATKVILATLRQT